MDIDNDKGRIFPVQDNRNQVRKNFIYDKMVIAPCQEDDPQIER